MCTGTKIITRLKSSNSCLIINARRPHCSCSVQETKKIVLLDMKLRNPTSISHIRKRKRMKTSHKQELRPGPEYFTAGNGAHVWRQVPVVGGGRAHSQTRRGAPALAARPRRLSAVTAVGTAAAVVVHGFRPEVEVGVLEGARCPYPAERESVMALPLAQWFS